MLVLHTLVVELFGIDKSVQPITEFNPLRALLIVKRMRYIRGGKSISEYGMHITGTNIILVIVSGL